MVEQLQDFNQMEHNGTMESENDSNDSIVAFEKYYCSRNGFIFPNFQGEHLISFSNHLT